MKGYSRSFMRAGTTCMLCPAVHRLWFSALHVAGTQNLMDKRFNGTLQVGSNWLYPMLRHGISLSPKHPISGSFTGVS